ncbi:MULTISPECIES: hypothetical protein [unclassified Streptomyces]|uniref:hypothetical protein n=1 Tax=unclassified Streptomyces TaxID=2593676 RepID=UPI00331BA497
MTDQPSLAHLLGATDPEIALAEDFTRVLNGISALLGYAEDGNWRSMHDKVGTLRRALAALDSRISDPAAGPNEPVLYRAPDVDAKRTVQLITAYAQEDGGSLGPVVFPLDTLDHEDAAAVIRGRQEATRRFLDELDGGTHAGQ